MDTVDRLIQESIDDELNEVEENTTDEFPVITEMVENDDYTDEDLDDLAEFCSEFLEEYNQLVERAGYKRLASKLRNISKSRPWSGHDVKRKPILKQLRKKSTEKQVTTKMLGQTAGVYKTAAKDNVIRDKGRHKELVALGKQLKKDL